MWQQISPLTRDPIGRPVWLSLHGIDLDKHWREIERRWPVHSQAIDWLAYPDSDIGLADIRARLILASIRAGELDRAALELDAFRRWHPTAVGRLGGQEAAYVVLLERLLTAAGQWPVPPPDGDWPTFAGSPSRSATAAPIGSLSRSAWAKPIQLFPVDVRRARSEGIPFDDQNDAQSRESHQPLSCFPVVVGRQLLYADATTIRAVDLATGKPAISADGILAQSDATRGERNAALLRPRLVAAGVPRHTLSVIKGIAYARLGRIETAQREPAPPPVNERIVGLDLNRDGILTFEARPDDEKWWFDGAPVGDGRRIYIAMRRGDVMPHAYVACFDVATGHRLWRTSIGAADTPAAGQGDEITHNLLSLVGDRIYFNTNLGLVAALDAETGRIDWLHSYERHSTVPAMQGVAGPLHFDRDPTPCLVEKGLVIVAPSDTPNVFALDADTGRPVWSTDQFADALHLLGVADENLIVTGHRFRIIDLRTGRLRYVWPESEHAGIRGMGRGVVAGNEVFWPTRKEIYVFDARTGARSRTPIDLPPISDAGANLVAAEGFLIVAGRERLLACGPLAPKPNDEAAAAAKVAGAL
jgi:hypothetical protein